MRPIINLDLPLHKSDDPWKPSYPNSPDLRFSYYHLLDLARQNKNGIGKVKDPKNPPQVAVIGAGVAGLATARELHRCGFTVTIYEATSRICGRQYTITHDKDIEPTGMEMGAMRFPFFLKPGEQNCILDYYVTKEAQMDTLAFPNPGAAPGNTGIYVNRGYGPKNKFDSPKFIPWPSSTDADNPPQDSDLKAVYDKVSKFVGLFTSEVGPLYVTDDWPKTWNKISNLYDQMTVSDLVYTPAITEYKKDGWFGGFGMTDEEAQLFALIGSGDGSWGAFYEVASMWFIRCVMFGYNSNLQSIMGITDKNKAPSFGVKVTDSLGTPFNSPQYNGIQSLGEWLMFSIPEGSGHSLYGAIHAFEANVALYLNSPVTEIEKNDGGGFTLTSELSGKGKTEHIYDYVVATPTLWSSQVNIKLTNFEPKDIPSEVISARNSQHNITSCKVFYPLKKLYWEKGSKIPQIMVTDTFAQDAYGVHWGKGQGAMLLSYTWEDDAVKMLPEDDKALADLMVSKLDDITMETVGEKISDYLDMAASPSVIHWARQPYSRGCAKLYRQRNWTLNYSLLTYNQTQSRMSGLYLAGENYGVEGGWTEPALRTAIDAVIHMIENSGSSFNNDFDPKATYPRYDTSFKPDNEFPPVVYRK